MHLPTIISAVNGLSFIFLISAYIAIKNKREDTHKKLMISALAASAVFLVLYLYYHSTVDEPTHFLKQGIIRYVYFTILISHTILAVAIFPFIGKVVYHAIKKDSVKHVALARKVLPVWAYVSCTGVIIYLMLYVL